VQETAEQAKIAFVDYNIEGIDALTDAECAYQMHTVIEYQLPTGRWETAWSEQEMNATDYEHAN